MTNTYQLTLADIASQEAAYVETIFSLANGHLGLRASDPVMTSATAGTIVNGFYETRPIVYGEAAVGYAKNHQTIVNLPDLRHIHVQTATGDVFRASERQATTLNLATGQLTEQFELRTAADQRIRLTLTSVVGQTTNEIGLRYQFEAINYTGQLQVTKTLAAIDGDEASDDPRKARQVTSLNFATAQVSPRQTNVTITTQTSHKAITLGVLAMGEALTQTIELADKPVLDYIGAVSVIDQPLPAMVGDFATIAADSAQYWRKVWANSAITIEGDDQLTQALHYNLFQLNQAAGRDGVTNIAAKGLSGTGYEGHYFWDTEMYMLPYFIYTQPELARQLLAYRYSILPQARKRAKALGVAQGALFAWRTINGEEASAYYPAGTAQYHINADIAYAVGTYMDVTDDRDFLNQMGFEIVLETARFWAQFGSYRETQAGRRFEFFDVTGPDEYTAIVNNNYYTNRMAKHNLMLAQQLARLVDPAVLRRLNVLDSEVQAFGQIADDIYLPYNQEHQINAQDDSFFDKPVWPFESTPKSHYPLLLHYHPLTIYRHQVAKQADTILAEYLFPADTDQDQLLREYRYYEQITTHDSSLSRSVFSMVASRLNQMDAAYHFFMDTAQMDLVDLQGNAADGLHLANLGGSWLALTTGFAGMHIVNGQLQFTGHLPAAWSKLTFRVRYQNRLLQVEIDQQQLAVVLLEGDALTITIDGEIQTIRQA
ncbi:glycoside hydrolase family 65 protein [Lacticaseibacillus saniviri]|uniref:TreP protein n=2 Tax=Lacticaseibacillus saniviri TaxID=931533 RepID=A0A0R2MSB5_9LACO|nr:glycosyl hydrolase family 65 protein [Lacticaseibacillus saniviri]KRO16454.1 treP protein [Lacticaseibacillus saniviri JCM 17471 = DSM 24301]MCG4282025.1 glycoside hydrolase family 65 protein [Lacticaseibacillus saniviri]